MMSPGQTDIFESEFNDPPDVLVENFVYGNAWYLLEEGQKLLDTDMKRFIPPCEDDESPLLVVFKESGGEIVVEIKYGSRAYFHSYLIHHFILIHQIKGVKLPENSSLFTVSKTVARKLWVFLIDSSFLKLSDKEAETVVQELIHLKKNRMTAEAWDARADCMYDSVEEPEETTETDFSPPWSDTFEIGSDDEPEEGCSECNDSGNCDMHTNPADLDGGG
jgi:hypothetical protein